MIHTSLVGKPLAVGRTAEVYPWGNGWVIKLYRPPWGACAEHEARIGRAIHAVGLPVPAVGDIVSVGERVGLLYERVDGTLMLRLMDQNPWSRCRWAQLLADLHVQVHAHDIIDLPQQRDRLARRITTAEELTLNVRQRLVEVLESLYERQCLCHGDLHPGNVILMVQEASNAEIRQLRIRAAIEACQASSAAKRGPSQGKTMMDSQGAGAADTLDLDRGAWKD